MSEESTEDKNYQRFMSFLRNSKNVSEHTVASYGIDICQFARLALGKDPLKEQIDWNLVTVDDARSFIVDLQEDNLTKTSILRKLSGMRSFFRYLVRDCRVVINPFTRLTGPKKQKNLPKYMTVTEVGNLLDAPEQFWRDALISGYARDEVSAEFQSKRDTAMLEMYRTEPGRCGPLFRNHENPRKRKKRTAGRHRKSGGKSFEKIYHDPQNDVL